ncbi:bifunctional diaminohydroxyphosphoribosylaminopyrimidine deaminase/5-amino-6-(5-phosphoribosylamino)uracil reductase RibD [Dyadobacter psychrotolerans]|uniref:Riboflavin biosynthesis protein RibD n=1 Tax=Dyadobacter psychrotolerans TaxID=2541721 RepID=A0A4R5DLY1_9BACT|nr:bifunctional diaminohydroxyphosphoribosylaminopyrimidine deaminase/5-amino-6-(5-phosphoribosylamino)uracil reductase RibD [Dyadobacter psychrotolerans]TDE11663.1 bifunctional diaminohydroxyphosphoribosylaminopyrimidine deaminase/5-amino-6-(5-phosphoribosylamino)uracil reductase RibD [Dyadobacter psychrotolerans]
MNSDIQWMQRALKLAEYGRGSVSPNPMVGCVIVHQDKIIGEGWHRYYGGPHAEVRAVEDAEKRGNGALLPESTVYVTLEPCSHTGKTPPCADLLIRKNVKRVVVCNGDPNPLVSGNGIRKMQDAGIKVDLDVLSSQGYELNKRFFTGFKQNRPYIILKWAETSDGFLGHENGSPVAISSEFSNMRVHKWRSEEDAILVGFNTALVDNPKLNVRKWVGKDPVRVILDRNLILPETLHVFDNRQPTVIVNYKQQSDLPAEPERYADTSSVAYTQVNPAADEIQQLLYKLNQRKIQSVFVEGGPAVLTSFIKTGLWDEIRRCQSTKILGEGIKAPAPGGILTGSEKIQDDLWTYYKNI